MSVHRAPTVYASLDAMLDVVPALGPYHRWLDDAWVLLRPPSVAMLLPALQRLRTLSEALGWDLPLVSEISVEEYDILLEQLRAVPGMDVPCMDTSGLGDAYPKWVTLISHQPEPSAYSCLHGLFFLYAATRRAKAVPSFASAIRHRGASLRAAGASETLLQILSEIEPAESPQDYFDLLCVHAGRIEQAKPNLARILFKELPKLLGLEFPELEQPADWQPPKPVSFFVADKLLGEPADEQLSPDIFVRPELAHPREQPSAKTEVLRAEQAIRTGNGLWVSTHVSCLSLQESRLATDWLIKFASKTLDVGRLVEHTGAVLLLLMLATGREVKRAASLLESLGQKNLLPRIDADRGTLAQSVMMNSDTYLPEQEAQPHLQSVGDRFEVNLPPPLVDLLQAWKKSAGLRASPSQHTDSIYIVLRKMRESTGIDFTEGRIRHTLACRAYDQSRDPVQVMWITMDNNGHSLAPTHYCAIQDSKIAETYVCTCWPMFNLNIEFKPQMPSSLVGARNLPKTKYLKSGVSFLLKRFNDPTATTTDQRGIAKKHNIMVQYLTAMLVVITGHRPTEALFKLTRWDFYLQEGLALYHDKKSDPSHFYRPVGLGSQISQQLRNYQAHLLALDDRLAELSGTTGLRKQVAAAMAGEAPWFFLLTEELVKYSPTVTQWREEFQEAFPCVQPNFGRTVIASEWRGRPRGAELAHLQLGHFGILGLPFEGDGPTAALDMARALSEPVDALWRKQGWRLRKGLASNLVMSEDSEGSRAPALLRSWKPELNALREETNEYRKRVRESRRERESIIRPVAERVFFRRLEFIHPELGRLIREHGSRRAEREISQRCTLAPDQIDQLLSSEALDVLDKEETVVDEAVQVALDNFAHRTLKQARTARYYTGPIPRRRVIARQVGMTPFVPGMFVATAALDELRAVFFREISTDPPTSDLTRVEWEFGRLALGLAIFSAVESEEVLEGLLVRRGNHVKNHVAASGILVQISDDPPRVWGLWNIAAALYLRAQRIIGRNEGPPGRDRLNEILAVMIPGRMIANKETDVLGCLLQTVSMENRIRFSSLARHALDPSLGSWSLPLDRQVALLRNMPDASKRVTDVGSRDRRYSPIVAPDRKSIREAYSNVMGQIPASGRKIRDEFGNLLIPPATWRRYRRRVISRLRRTVAENKDVPELGRAFALWAITMLKRTRGPGDYVLTEGSVRKYLGLVGPPLIDRIRVFSPTVLSDEEFVDLYQEIIEEKTPGVRRATARELLNFHNILVGNFGAPEVDSSEFADYLVNVENRVNAELILPCEAVSAMRLFSNTTDKDLFSHEYDLRLYNQVWLLYVLLVVTGARLGEIVGLLFRDIYQIDEFIFVRIRPNPFRRTKSRAAKRVLEISLALDPEERRALLSWLRAEKQRIGGRFSTRLIFSELLTGDPVDRAQLREPMQQALRKCSPMSLSANQIRHSRGTRVQIDCALGTSNASFGSRADAPLTFPEKPKSSFLLPRDLQSRKIWMGHAQLTTTNRSYGHLPWVYQWPQAEIMEKHLDITAVMGIRDARYEAAKKYYQRNSKGLSAALITSFLGRNHRHSMARAAKNEDNTADHIQLQPPDHLPAARYLMLAAKSVEHEELWRSCGLTRGEANALRVSAKRIAHETGIAFFEEDIRKIGRARASALPRMNSSTQALMRLIDAVYDVPNETTPILESYVATAIPSRRQQIRLEQGAASKLRSIIRTRCQGFRLAIDDEQRILQDCRLIDTSGAECNHLLAWVLAIMATIHYSGISRRPPSNQDLPDTEG
ncbi:MAG: hypothetical protein ACXIUB_03545 [Wenzhouxiangella sp.]